MSRRTYPEQETWVMRKCREAGVPFNVDTTCQYTGHPLHMFPIGSGDDWLMGFWRTDGHLSGAYTMTPQEKAWILANPLVFGERCQRFRRWLESTRLPKP